VALIVSEGRYAHGFSMEHQVIGCIDDFVHATKSHLIMFLSCHQNQSHHVPYLSGLHHIGAVALIVSEGHCALQTSIALFKFMFLYGLIQFVGVLLLYSEVRDRKPLTWCCIQTGP
jgi:hypothetical protein